MPTLLENPRLLREFSTRTNGSLRATDVPAAAWDRARSPFVHTPARPVQTPGEITSSTSGDNFPQNPAQGQTSLRTPAAHEGNPSSGCNTVPECTKHPR